MSSSISETFKKKQMHALLDSMDLGALLRLGFMLQDRGLMNLTRSQQQQWLAVLRQVPCESLEGSCYTREHSIKSASETNSDLQSKSFGKKAHHFTYQFPPENHVSLCKSACELDRASAESFVHRIGIEPPEDVELPTPRQVRPEKKHMIDKAWDHQRQLEQDRALIDISDVDSTTASESTNTCINLENAVARMAPTTMMICLLPFKLSEQELLQEMDLLNFSGTYNYVYMPNRGGRSRAKKPGKVREGNVGYAFVNFRTAEKAKEFAAAFEGYSFKKYDEKLLTSVRVATRQVCGTGDFMTFE